MFSRQTSLAAVLFASFLSATALADRKRIGANDCLFEYDDPAYGNHWDWDRGECRIGTQNPWPEFLPLVIRCPLVRSNTTNTNGLTSLKLNVYKQTSTTFNCWAQSNDKFGSYVLRVARSTTQTGRSTLDWTTNMNSSLSKGTYAVTCDVIGTVDETWGDEVESIEYNEP